MKLMSKELKENGSIPSEFTCDGADVSPPLSWDEAPDETRSFALSVTDPDFSRGTWIHWQVYDIPKDVRQIEKNSLPRVAKEVENDFGKKSYGGPCPPSGIHRYFFTIYALDVEHLERVDKSNFMNKIKKHMIGKAVIKTVYKRR